MSNTEPKQDSPVTSQTFWDAAYPMIAITEKHPFLVSMVDGTLNEENFKYYVTQDALYLKEFADCLRRVSAKAPDASDQKRLSEFATGAEECELALHDSFFREWKIEAPPRDGDGDPMRQMPNCLLYTSYMKRVVATESYAQGLAVLLPCFWVYMHVGHVMLGLREKIDGSAGCCGGGGGGAAKSQRKPQYDAWIDMYAGEEFEKEVRDFIGMVDAECERIQSSSDGDGDAKAVLERMQQHFIMGCKLEHMFWDQASTQLRWPELGGL